MLKRGNSVGYVPAGERKFKRNSTDKHQNSYLAPQFRKTTNVFLPSI